MNENAPAPGLAKASFMFVLVAMFLFYEMGVQVSTSVMTVPLMKDLHLDAFSLGIMSGAYYYSYTAMQIPAGLLYDRFHVRNVVIFPLLLCSLGCYLFGLSTSLTLGAVARFMTGGGSAFAFIAVLVVAADVFSPKWFAFLTGLTQMLAAFGAMCGEAPLVPLVKSIGWRHTMSVLGVIGVLLASMIWLFVRYRSPIIRENKNERRNIWHSVRIISLNPQTWLVALYACLLWAPMAAFASLWGVPFLKAAGRLNDMTAASLVVVMWLGIAFGAPLVGWWSDVICRRKIPLLILAILGAVSFSLIMLVPTMPIMVMGVLLFFVGMSCSGQALSFAVVRDINLRDNIAAAIGFNNMAVVVAGAIFQPLVGKLINMHWDGTLVDGRALYSMGDYRYGLLAVVVGYVISVVTCCFIREPDLKEIVEIEKSVIIGSPN